MYQSVDLCWQSVCLLPDLMDENRRAYPNSARGRHEENSLAWSGRKQSAVITKSGMLFFGGRQDYKN